jgi:hypothetical protein
MGGECFDKLLIATPLSRLPRSIGPSRLAAMNRQYLVFFGIATAILLTAQIGVTPTGMYGPSSITGAPYSATQISERIQTLADGTRITQPVRKGLMYRDSAGRTRNEMPFPVPMRAGPPPPVRISIFDPVAGFRYEFNSANKVAQKFAMPAARPAIAQPASPAASTPPAAGLIIAGTGKLTAPVTTTQNGAAVNTPKTTSESLGSQLIEGVTAEGTRTTTTWAVGSVGNDREIDAISETWFSKQLGVAVLTKNSDPRFGHSITKLTNISLVEPDPALFMPPADYDIKDMAAQTTNR